jgi:hypothetical protein
MDEGLDAINELNNAIFSQVISGIKKLLPSEEENRQQINKEIEELRQNPDDPANKIMLEFYSIRERYSNCSDAEEKDYLLKAMKQKAKQLQNCLDQD